MPVKEPSQKSANPTTSLVIPELEHTERAVLNALASVHSRRAYKHAIDRFIAWYCSEPRLARLQSVYSIAIPLVPRVSSVVGRHNQSSSVRDPAVSR